MFAVLIHLIEIWRPYFEIDGITEISVNRPKEVILEVKGEFDIRQDDIGWGEPNDVANMVCYLLSNRAKWLSGQNYVIDSGGRGSRLA